jgi:hypothetical protein
MHGGEEELGVSLENGLGAVAVVGIKVPDGHARTTEEALGVDARDRDLIQVAESHRLAGGRVMTRRAHEGEGRGLFFDGVTNRVDRGGNGAAGVIRDRGEVRRVAVEIARDGKTGEMSREMGETQHLVRGGIAGLAPGPIGVRRAQMRRGANGPRRLLGSQRRAVFGAAWIMQNQHERRAAKMPKRGKKPNGGPGTAAWVGINPEIS